MGRYDTISPNRTLHLELLSVINLTLEDSGCVALFDQCRCYLVRNDGWLYVKRRPHEAMDPSCQ